MTAIWITAARRWAAIFAAIGFITLMDVPELRAQGLLILDSDLGILKCRVISLALPASSWPTGRGPFQPDLDGIRCRRRPVRRQRLARL
jgi:hypothetical protein